MQFRAAVEDFEEESDMFKRPAGRITTIS